MRDLLSDFLSDPRMPLLIVGISIGVVAGFVAQCLMALTGYLEAATQAKRDEGEAASEVGRAAMMAASAYADRVSRLARNGGSDV